MRVSRKDLESLVRVQISALCSFLAIPRYSAYTKKDQQLVLVHDWLLQHPGALPVKAWLWVKEGRAGTPKPAHFSPEELADTVQYVLEENVCADETMEEMDEGSTLVDPRSKRGQEKTPPRMSEGGLSQEGDSHPPRSQSVFPGGASGGATLMSTQDDDDDGFSEVRSKKRRSAKKREPPKEVPPKSQKVPPKSQQSDLPPIKMFEQLEQTMGAIWSTLKAVQAAIVKDSANHQVCSHSECVKTANLVAGALCRMDGLIGGLAASKLQELAKKPDSTEKDRPDGGQEPPKGKSGGRRNMECRR